MTARGVAEALEAHADLWVVGATEVASPAHALTAASTDAALVVLGSRGYGRVTGALLGSVAFAVAARATCPVIVVKDESADRPVGSEYRIVVGTDGSASADAAVDFAADRATIAGASLEISDCTGGHQVQDVDERELRAAAARIADSAADRARTIPTRGWTSPPRRGLSRRARARRCRRQRRPGGGRHPWPGSIRGDAPRIGQSRGDPRRQLRGCRRRRGAGMTPRPVR